MTRNLCRHADKGRTGHLCDAIAGVIASQGTVFANGRPVARRGDKAMPHTIRVCVGNRCFCVNHRANINAGSSTVFCLGIPVARIHDSFDKARMITGSVNVFAGG